MPRPPRKSSRETWERRALRPLPSRGPFARTGGATRSSIFLPYVEAGRGHVPDEKVADVASAREEPRRPVLYDALLGGVRDARLGEAEELGHEAARELVARRNLLVELRDADEGPVHVGVVQRARRVDRQAVLARAVAADAVHLLHAEADQVELVVAARAKRIGLVLFVFLAGRFRRVHRIDRGLGGLLEHRCGGGPHGPAEELPSDEGPPEGGPRVPVGRGGGERARQRQD